MSPRPHRKRFVQSHPPITGLNPAGGRGRRHSRGEIITLQLEEYEALRLSDYLGNNHEKSAAEMQVSRPTFTRICTEARRKMAQALVEGRPVVIDGGNVIMRNEVCVCPDCGYETPHQPGMPCNEHICEKCGSTMKRKGGNNA